MLNIEFIDESRQVACKYKIEEEWEALGKCKCKSNKKQM